MLAHTDAELPEKIRENLSARAYFGICKEIYESIEGSECVGVKSLSLETALKMDEIIRQYILDNGKTVVDWSDKTQLTGPMKIEMEDYLIDEVKRKYDIPLTFDDMDCIIERCVEIVKLWFKQ